ncbi:unnamed protein product [Knipowitschia caucasica]|uniref:Uncharacterized protein n=1 Tax=Knipowitschia caucasica TaxID=637954 RepID=A0AAV2LXQ6_KNICA
MSTIKGISTDLKNSKVEKVIGKTGDNLTVECPLKVLIRKPSADCVQDYAKCRSYFQALMFLRSEGSSETIVKTDQDHGESGRHSLQYSERLVTVGIFNISKADEGLYVCGAVAPSGNTSSTLFQVLVEDADVLKAPTRPRSLLLLLLLVPAVLLLVGGLWVCRKKKSNRDSPKAETSGDIKLQDELYENCPARPLDSADGTYQSLCVETRDHNIYSCLNPAQ